MILAISWLLTVVILTSYGLSAHLERPNIFHWANVVTAIPLAAANIHFGASYGAALNIVFGLLAASALMRKRDLSE